MIDKTLLFLAEELTTFVQNKDFRYRDKPVALVCDLADYKGEPTFLKRLNNTSGDFLLLTLINVEEETIGKAQSNVHKKSDESQEILNPEIRINLYILASAVSNMQETQRYTNCLRLISYSIGCFQYKHCFNKNDSPGLPAEVSKIVLELVSPTFEQQNHIWGGLGAKYQPSILFKIKLLTYLEVLDKDGDLRIRKVDTSLAVN